MVGGNKSILGDYRLVKMEVRPLEMRRNDPSFSQYMRLYYTLWVLCIPIIVVIIKRYAHILLLLRTSLRAYSFAVINQVPAGKSPEPASLAAPVVVVGPWRENVRHVTTTRRYSSPTIYSIWKRRAAHDLRDDDTAWNDGGFISLCFPLPYVLSWICTYVASKPEMNFFFPVFSLRFIVRPGQRHTINAEHQLGLNLAIVEQKRRDAERWI